jgi:hypothetical protein
MSGLPALLVVESVLVSVVLASPLPRAPDR